MSTCPRCLRRFHTKASRDVHLTWHTRWEAEGFTPDIAPGYQALSTSRKIDHLAAGQKPWDEPK